jgi:hypothetical protein
MALQIKLTRGYLLINASVPIIIIMMLTLYLLIANLVVQLNVRSAKMHLTVAAARH